MKNRKRILSLVPAILAAALVQGRAEFLQPPSAYNFGPEGRTLEDAETIRDFAKPNEMVSILPNRPVAATDKDGNRVYFTGNGKLIVKYSRDGKIEFSVGNRSVQKNAKGEVETVTEGLQGSNVKVIHNEKGELLGYQKLAYGGKVTEEYDYQGFKTKSIEYNEYGKSVQYVLNELSMTKTVTNESGQPMFDVNFEGYKVAVYEYDDRNRLVSKTDMNNSYITYFDKYGNMTKTVDPNFRDANGDPAVRVTYNYTNEEGKWILVSAVDAETQDVTEYEYGKQKVTRYGSGPGKGAVKTEYHWDGSTLVYSFDTDTKLTTWYGIDGRLLSVTAADGVLSKQFLYYQGRQIGMWDNDTKTVTLNKYQREEISGHVDGIYEVPPTAEQVQQWVDQGLIVTLQNEYDDKGRRQQPSGYRKQQ